MQTFLEQVATYIKDNFGDDLKDQCIVFTNRRANLFFNKYLKSLYSKPAWSPKTITISELFEVLNNGHKTDKLILLFELYESYNYILKTNEPFDRFYYWGNMMLRDFDEIDKYLISPKLVFSNIKAHKEIEKEIDYLQEDQKKFLVQFWNVFEQSKISQEKQHFIDIWDKLFDIYTDFNQRCDQRNLFYEGKLYKALINKIRTGEELPAIFNNIHFVGFNALNECERSLFKHFKKNKSAHFYWDYDPYYVDRNYHEAGKFLRQNIIDFASPKDFTINNNLADRFKDRSLNVNIYSVGLEIGQAAKCGAILRANNIDCAKHQTAIVLPDEHLLLPVLENLPQEIDKVNISMGYSFKETPLYALFDNLIALQLKTDKANAFYHKPCIAILNHPYINEQEESFKSSFENIVKKNIIWPRFDQIPKTPLTKLIFVKIDSSIDFNEMILATLMGLYAKFREGEDNQLEREFIYHTFKEVQRINENLKSMDLTIDLGTYLKLFKQILNDIAVPFIGEPLDGLQIMGVLETRSLDFKNLFILSMNEGKMPATGQDNSFIPYTLRKGYGLPTIEEFDAVYAYYFYRLIQRSENVFLFHNNIQEGDIKSEKSRFLQQLEFELNANNQIKFFAQKNNFKQTEPLPILIDEALISKYFSQFKQNSSGQVEKYLTPSAINKYIDCSLAFYLRYILKLFPKDEIKEDIDHASFGNILHKVMEELYQDQILQKGCHIHPKDIDHIIAEIDGKIETSIEKTLGKDVNQKDGDLFVIAKIVKQYVLAILEKDKTYAPFNILGLETDKADNYTIITKSGFGIEGKIDRIDEKDGLIRIVDYKTGSVNYKVKSIEGLVSDQNAKNKYALQAFLYAALYKHKHGALNVIQPTIIGVKDLFSNEPIEGAFHYTGKETFLEKGPIYNYADIDEDWLAIIDEKLNAVANGNELIEQTSDIKTCDFCDYKSICSR